MANTAQTVYPPGHSIAPESLAPLPADWATVSYALTIIPDPLDPTLPILAWAVFTSGGTPVTGDGWNFDFGNDWDG